MATIVVIDDSKEVLTVLRIALRRLGHLGLVACGGEEGLALVKQHSVALVLCDLLMPGMSGLETIRSLRKLDPDIKIVAISGDDVRGESPLARALALGASTVLTKPFGLSELKQVLRDLLPPEPRIVDDHTATNL